jgi:hypothetical protein
MNKKKIISGLLALTFVFGGAALPNTVVNNSVVASASEEEAEVLTFGDYKYTLLEDGTVEIVKYTGSDADIEIPGEINDAAVTSIGEEVFEHCETIKSIVIPDGVKTIGNYAFSGCESIESLVIPDSVEFIDRGAFSYCTNLKSIKLPDGLKQIASLTFVECSNLDSVVIPDSVENISGEAFYGCSGLKSITLPKGLKKIGHGVFYACISLEDITIPEGVEQISGMAFSSCNNLENVVIPDSVKTIGEYSFSGCHNLKSITIPASVTEIGENAFEDVTINCYANSAAEKFAIANNLNYKLIDEKLPNCPPPKKMVIKAEYSSEYHQIRLRWKPHENAEKYGIAVYLAGKWRVWTCSIPADVTVFTSPKNLTPGTEYKIAVAARVNGNWNVRDAIYDAVKVTVK